MNDQYVTARERKQIEKIKASIDEELENMEAPKRFLPPALVELAEEITESEGVA